MKKSTLALMLVLICVLSLSPAYAMPKAQAELANIMTVTEVLDNDQIKVLPTTPAQIIASPGEGKLVHIISASLIYDFQGGAYESPSENVYLYLRAGGVITARTDDIKWIFEDSLQRWYGRLGGDPFFAIEYGQSVEAQGYDVPENQPCTLFAATAVETPFAGGGPANTLAITVLYTIIDL